MDWLSSFWGYRGYCILPSSIQVTKKETIIIASIMYMASISVSGNLCYVMNCSSMHDNPYTDYLAWELGSDVWILTNQL